MPCYGSSNCAETLLQILAIGLSNGAVIALNAIAVTLVYGVVRTINFAHGDLFALATVVVTTLVTRLALTPDWPVAHLALGLAAALGAALVFGGLVNAAVERAAFRPFRTRSRLAPPIATLGLSFILYQVALIWRRFGPSWIPGEHRSVPGVPELPRGSIHDFMPAVDLVAAAGLPLGVTYALKDLLILLLAASAAALVSITLHRTRMGRALRATAENPDLAIISGVNRDGAIAGTFALGGALAGLAAFAFALYYGHPFANHGMQSGLTALTAAILGGIGNPLGAFLGALLLGELTALSDFFLAAHWTPVLIQSLLIGLLLLRPSGLAGDQPGADIPDVAESSALADPGAPTRHRIAAWTPFLMLLLAALYPSVDASLGWSRLGLAASIATFAVVALGLNILVGYCGLLNLGFAVPFGVGAFVAAILTAPWHRVGAQLPQPLDFLPVLVLSGLAASLLGLLGGLAATRLRGDYLAIATLAFGQLVTQVLLNLGDWTGGVRGMSALPAPTLLTHTLRMPVERYYLAVALLALTVVASHRLLRSRIGRAWLAVGADETAAAGCGVDVARARILAFVWGSTLAGSAGALYASSVAYIDPDLTGFRISAMLLAMVIVGGTGRVTGVILGTAIIVALDRLAIPLLAAGVTQLRAAPIDVDVLTFSVRELSSLTFGLALYLTTLIRAGRPSGSPRPPRRRYHGQPPVAVEHGTHP